jgi:hypothetical protein
MSDIKSDAAPRRPTLDIHEEDGVSLRFASLKEEADQHRGRV